MWYQIIAKLINFEGFIEEQVILTSTSDFIYRNWRKPHKRQWEWPGL